jgi:hypothetical protein
MALTPRQQTAETMAAELRQRGAFCVSPMPLKPGERLRFEVRATDYNDLIERLSVWGWRIHQCGDGTRIIPVTKLLPKGRKVQEIEPVPVIAFEVDVAADAPPQETRPGGEIGDGSRQRRRLLGLRLA